MRVGYGRRGMTRRALLRPITLTVGGLSLAACAPAPEPATKAVPTAAPAPAAAAPATPAAGPTSGPTAVSVPTQAAPTSTTVAKSGAEASPRGALNVAIGINFPSTLDATKDGSRLTYLGLGETLTRSTPRLTIVPWLAEGVTNVNSTTWRVSLRRNAQFWDGSPVDAEAVAASFKRNFETQPAADLYISKDTAISVENPSTLLFTTPRPVGDFPVSLSAQHFLVHKPGESASVMTGPYRPARFERDQQLILDPFRDHWAGPPPLEQLTVKLLPDGNARVLALQSGDVDVVYGVPTEAVTTLGPDVEVKAIASSRVHFIVLNHQKPPFNDRVVRRVMSLAIDRQALNDAALQGLGKPIVGLFPPGHGLDPSVPLDVDVERARRMLEEAGWTSGADGIRVKDGSRLAFTLFSAPGRAELTPMAVMISGQLKGLGYEIQVQESRTLSNQLRDGGFEAAMSSTNSLGTGDPQRMFSHSLVSGGVDNYGTYENQQLETTVARLRAELDPSARTTIAREAQEIVLADAANVYLVAAPYVLTYQKGKVRDFDPHPSDLYFVDHSLTSA